MNIWQKSLLGSGIGYLFAKQLKFHPVLGILGGITATYGVDKLMNLYNQIPKYQSNLNQISNELENVSTVGNNLDELLNKIHTIKLFKRASFLNDVQKLRALYSKVRSYYEDPFYRHAIIGGLAGMGAGLLLSGDSIKNMIIGGTLGSILGAHYGLNKKLLSLKNQSDLLAKRVQNVKSGLQNIQNKFDFLQNS